MRVRKISEPGNHVRLSPYAEAFWPSILGPSCWLLWSYLAGEDDGAEIDLPERCAEIGILRPSVVEHVLGRLAKFRIVFVVDDEVRVDTRVRWLSPAQIARLPKRLAAVHDSVRMLEEHRRREAVA